MGRWLIIVGLFLTAGMACISTAFAQDDAPNLVIHVNFKANGRPLILNDSSYTNVFGEKYSISRLKFYMSHISLKNESGISASEDIALVDASTNQVVNLNLAPGQYDQLQFLLGVDSALNCSGAQSGALDPLNGMFWTWNTGYIFFKMEGYSPASTADQQRIEQHIGGYRSPYNAARNILLTLPQKLLLEKKVEKHIYVELNLDKFFNAVNPWKLSDKSMLMSPGPEAMKAADNFLGMFSVQLIP
jgi:hypothetical protein